MKKFETSIVRINGKPETTVCTLCHSQGNHHWMDPELGNGFICDDCMPAVLAAERYLTLNSYCPLSRPLK